MRPLLLYLFTAVAIPSSALAQPGLPPPELVRGALDAHPSVEAARARVDAAKAEARALKAGPHEIVATGGYINRAVYREGHYDEVDTTFTRAIRLPGKARLDRRAGELGVEAAENRMEDARHQAARLLAELWWDWLGASAEAEIDRQAVANLEKALAGVRRRVELRDASQLEADQAAAALNTARLAAEQSAGRADYARTRLSAQYPGLALPPAPVELPLPELPPDGLAALRPLVIQRSHEIAAADAEASRLRALAERAREDRIADPSIGLRLFSERSGAERGIGVIASVPLGGRHRSAVADRTRQEAAAAQAEAAAVRLNVHEMANGDFVRAESALRAWRSSRSALEAQVAAVLKTRKGYSLGAIDLSDLLLGERQTQDAFRAEAAARTEALRAVTRLRIDSHELWIGDDEENRAGPGDLPGGTVLKPEEPR